MPDTGRSTYFQYTHRLIISIGVYKPTEIFFIPCEIYLGKKYVSAKIKNMDNAIARDKLKH